MNDPLESPRIPRESPRGRDRATQALVRVSGDFLLKIPLSPPLYSYLFGCVGGGDPGITGIRGSLIAPRSSVPPSNTNQRRSHRCANS